MKDILRPILELSVVLPGLLLAYFPVKSYLKQTPGKLAAWLLPLMTGLCIAAGLLYYLHLGQWQVVMFFLHCVLVAALYGAYSVNKRIFFVQGVPAIAAILAIWAMQNGVGAM